MSTKQPAIVETYLRASNAHDTAAMLLCFAKDAVVHDEGRKYHGVAAISGWVETTTRRYQPTIAVTDTSAQAGEAVVTGRASGNFDGSPAELHYHFILADDHITALTIR